MEDRYDLIQASSEKAALLSRHSDEERQRRSHRCRQQKSPGR
ncbi:hypothetical protein ACFYP4_14180 [Streptomyces sp. NPDC005551]